MSAAREPALSQPSHGSGHPMFRAVSVSRSTHGACPHPRRFLAAAAAATAASASITSSLRLPPRTDASTAVSSRLGPNLCSHTRPSRGRQQPAIQAEMSKRKSAGRGDYEHRPEGAATLPLEGATASIRFGTLLWRRWPSSTDQRNLPSTLNPKPKP